MFYILHAPDKKALTITMQSTFHMFTSNLTHTQSKLLQTFKKSAGNFLLSRVIMKSCVGDLDLFSVTFLTL